MAFHLYILRCADDSYYIGHTEDLEARIAAHQMGRIPGYTQKRRPVTLVFSQDFPTREEALAAERQIKGWNRNKKEALIREQWDLLPLLAMNSERKAELDSQD
ncbi:MAG: GIY-YIG nuclease family protein [Dehalococcoidia bacterium]